MKIEEIYQRLITDTVNIHNIEECALVSNLAVVDVFEKISLLFAIRFHQGIETYENADDGMNRVWSLMIDYTLKNKIETVELCHSIYLAFDEGEYCRHGNSFDPVETYTKPKIAEILKATLRNC